MALSAVWFGVICALWSAYFVTEGFDFGIGMLVPWLGRREADRAAMFGAIGPVWDGNEVWLLVAGGATFAAFPQWYATMFSGFYVALLIVLVMLIVRVVSFEWRTKSDDPRWRGLWTWINVIASYGAPLVWGVGLSALLFGTPIDAHQEFAGSFWSLVSWYSLLGGGALVVLCAAHGAVFLSLRTATPALRTRALRAAGPLSVAAVVCGGTYLVATLAVGVARNHQDVVRGVPVLVAGLVTAIAALVCIRLRRPAAAFFATALTIGLAVVLLFVELYPRVMVSSTNFADSLTVANSSSADYTMTVMTVVTALLLPVVAVYQVWIYRVFRVRVSGSGQKLTPADVVAGGRGSDEDGPGGA